MLIKTFKCATEYSEYDITVYDFTEYKNKIIEMRGILTTQYEPGGILKRINNLICNKVYFEYDYLINHVDTDICDLQFYLMIFNLHLESETSSLWGIQDSISLRTRGLNTFKNIKEYILKGKVSVKYKYYWTSKKGITKTYTFWDWF